MLPLPRSITVQPGSFVINDPATFLSTLSGEIDKTLPPEGYRVTVTPTGVSVVGGSPAGAFYGVQTVKQLLPTVVYRAAWQDDGPWEVPCIEITDSPAFAWRGCMLDVARHFMPKHDVLRFIDLLAMHKLNVLHLHLTDDQGWRLQIRRYPRLTSVGAWRRESMVGSRQHERFNGRPHGGFYTQDDIREIVAYAAQRFVTVVPEIDLPGHTQAALAAYPQWGLEETEVSTRWGISRGVLNTLPETVAAIKDIFGEVLELFPAKHIGIGGDECGDREAQSRYALELYSFLTAHGRIPLGWDEVLEVPDLPPMTIAAWRGPGVTEAIASAGYEVVACPDTSVYLDYRQSDDPREPIPVGTVLTLSDVWHFEVPDHERVLGAQVNLWTEHADSPRTVDYLAFPRLSAFAEAVWSPQPSTYDMFVHRLTTHLKRLDAAGVEYRPLDGPLPWQERPDAAGWPRDRAEREAELRKQTQFVRRLGAPDGDH
ncbi:beta-N-acetylhexosaminidase [Catelliglobosispora koreensis]|uniref:beta-N-acetylhexosaminidase n=1 Tax=Catelliglobosispora koreensis TaxID=129052 RepID=UPI00035C6582|nr:beta-N-acetylhexosaminidase [Catelliglobosispora koreensis]